MERLSWMTGRALILFVLLSGSVAQAFIEVGMSGSYRRSNLDEFNYEEYRSLTGSVSYYFMPQSALEFSYTRGLNIVQTASFNQKTETEYELIGLDFVLSYGTRESILRPYIKAGIVHVDRKIVTSSDLSVETVNPEDGLAPSLGLGAKFVVQKQLAFKLGLESWTSPLRQDPIEYNYSAKLGVSWIF